MEIKLKLHVGCGNTIIKGWVNIDKYVTGKDIQQIPIESLPYETNSVELIYSSHMIEHLLPNIRDKALKEWRRVLIPKTGKLIIRCPYAPFYLQKWLDSKPKDRLVIDNILGMQNHGEGMYNHGLYCNESLAILLKQFGYTIVENKVTSHRHPKLTEQITNGIVDLGIDVPGLEKRDIYCVAVDM